MQTQSRIYSLQALRAVAALLVVIFHVRLSAFIYQERYGMGQTVFYDFALLRDLGAIGVDVFFVISGFVMTYITWREPRCAWAVWPFLRRRLARIVPTYWLYTIILAAIWAGLPGQVTHSVDLPAFVQSMLFIPYQPAPGNLAPVLSVGWTLSYEMYFYILVSLGLLLPFRIFFAGLGVFFAACIAVGAFVRPASPVLQLCTSSLILEFYLGMAIALVFLARGHIDRRLGWGALLVGLAVLASTASLTDATLVPIRGFVWGFPAAGLVLWFLSFESRDGFLARPLFQALGASSYSLYLTHLLVLPFLGRAFAAAGVLRHIPLDVYVLAAIVLCMAVAHFLYRFVEQPLNRIAGRLLGDGTRQIATT